MSELGEIPPQDLQNVLSDSRFYNGLLELARHTRDLECLGGLSIFHTGGQHGYFADMRVHLPTVPEDNEGGNPTDELNFEMPLLRVRPGAPVDFPQWTPLVVLNAESASEPVNGDVRLIPTKRLVLDYMDRLWRRNPHSILGYAALHNVDFKQSVEGNLLLGLMKAGPDFDMPNLLGVLGEVAEGDDLLTAMTLSDLRTVQIRYAPGETPMPENPEQVAALYASS